jgi:hypothetical protein
MMKSSRGMRIDALTLVGVALLVRPAVGHERARPARAAAAAESNAWFCVMPRSTPFDECPIALPDDPDSCHEGQKRRPPRRPRFRVGKGEWLDFHDIKWRCIPIPDRSSYVVTVENYGKPLSSFRIRPHAACPQTRVQSLDRQNMYNVFKTGCGERRSAEQEERIEGYAVW